MPFSCCPVRMRPYVRYEGPLTLEFYSFVLNLPSAAEDADGLVGFHCGKLRRKIRGWSGLDFDLA